MLEIKDKSKCCGCGACINVCTKGCIKMERDGEGFYYPSINKEKCMECGLCEKVCPMIIKTKEANNLISYAAYSKDNDVLYKSSSGGLFTHLAQYILKDKGVVYGAAFNEKNQVQHIRVDGVQQLELIKKSKYVQSNIKEIFKSVRQDLIDEKKVLFTGVGCQINGLVNYLNVLKVNCEKLFLIDIICHGVPSEKVWEKYLSELGVDREVSVDFRNKDNGWVNYNIKIGNYNKSHYQDAYMKTFLSDCNLRESCYNCNSKGQNRYADITLGDFWGVNALDITTKNNMGTSAIIVHTDKGNSLIDAIHDDVFLETVDYEDVIKGNPSYFSSSKRNKNRDKFFENLDKYDLNRLSKKYCDVNFINKIKYKIKRILKRFINKTKAR